MLFNLITHFVANFNILAIDNIDDVFWWICLFFDGIVYSLVAHSYNMFLLIAGLNFNVLSEWFSPLINRIESLILVLIMFKLGISFITYMVNPDKFKDGKKGGAGLIKNILIVAILLISYGFIFDLFNELTMLFIGYSDSYNFVVLKDIADVDNDGKGNSGLINRLIFGEQEIPGNYGNQFSVVMLNVFIKDVSGTRASSIFTTIAGEEEVDAIAITDLADAFPNETSYKWPVLSNVVGIYLIVTIVKICIEVAIRIFKLITLRLASPLVIITMVDDGFDSKYFKDFIKVYMSEYTSVFIRLAVMFLITAFASMLNGNIGALLGDKADGIMGSLIFVILIVAAFKFANELPKLIDSIAGTKLSADGKGSGFGSFLGGLAGSVLGAAGGLASGIANRAGFLGTASNVLSGGINGGTSGSKSQNVADFFKNNGEVINKNNERASNISRMGGYGSYLRGKGESALGIPQTQAARAQHAADTRKALDNMMEARRNALAERTSGRGYNYGSSEDETIAKSHKTDEYRNRMAKLEKARVDMQNNADRVDDYLTFDSNGNLCYMDKNGNLSDNVAAEDRMSYAEVTTQNYQAALKNVDNFDKEVKEDYANALMNNSEVNKDSEVKYSTDLYDKRAGEKYSSKQIASGQLDDGNATDANGDKISTTKDAIKYAGIHFAGESAKFKNKDASRRANRTGRY